jgi:HSP20 family protein
MSERDLFADFDRMRRQMDELLGGALERSGVARGHGGFAPPVDVAYTSEPASAIVTVELAGVDPDDLNIEIQGRRLVLSGHRGPAVGCEIYQQVEIERGRFRRTVELAAEVSAEQAKASYEDGMLRIELPLVRREPRARAVPIETGKKQ